MQGTGRKVSEVHDIARASCLVEQLRKTRSERIRIRLSNNTAKWERWGGGSHVGDRIIRTRILDQRENCAKIICVHPSYH